ncbi:MAG TPA: ABC transporter permease [Vicinamibacterales bacterium]
MASPHHWQTEIHARAAREGVALTDAMTEEIGEHLEDLYVAAIRDGCSDEDARARARAALEESTMDVLGRPAATRSTPAFDEAAAMSTGPWTSLAAGGRRLNLSAALRLAVRQLRRRPGFAVVTVLVLGLGIGASTTVFTIVDSVLLHPLPYKDPARLVTLWDANAKRGLAHQTISPVNFMDYRELPAFEGAAAWWRPNLNLIDPGLDPMRVNAVEVSGNLFDVLGVRPQLGEGFPIGGPFFSPGQPIIVISDRLWRTRYGADPSIVGKPLRLNGRANIVAGVMPPKFHYPDDIDVWQRLQWDLHFHSRAAHFMEAVVRVRGGTSIEQASVAANTLAQRLITDFPQTNRDWTVTLVPLLDEQLGYYRPALFVLVGAVLLVLIIGCLNVASLLLTRALSREREIAVRIAMGASPRQLVAQLLAEAGVLSMAGAIAGVLASFAALPALVAAAPAGVPRLDEAHVDLRALTLAVAIAAATTLVFGLVPAFVLMRRKTSVELRSGERGSSRGARRTYSIIVAGQVALACTLLVSSVLLIRTVANMMATPTGVDANDVVTTSIQLSATSAATAVPTVQQTREAGATHETILERIRQQPGVMSAGAATMLPFELGWRLPFEIEGDDVPVRADDRKIAQYQTITDGYFESMRATIASGRSFSRFDTPDSTPVVVVNESFVARYLAGRPAIGRRIVTTVRNIGPLGYNVMLPPGPFNEPPKPRAFEVVGVVKDVRNTPIGEPLEPAIYFGVQQFPFFQLLYAVRAADSGAAVRAVRAALTATAPNVPLGPVRTWAERMTARTTEPRLLMMLLTFFGATAAFLAALGVYGLFSWSVAQRTRELAIRLTLGAQPVRVGASVVRQSLALVAIGLVVGFAIVRVSEAALTRVLFELSPHDPKSLAAAGALLLVVALAACVPPAMRALRVDPVEGLRAE